MRRLFLFTLCLNLIACSERQVDSRQQTPHSGAKALQSNGTVGGGGGSTITVSSIRYGELVDIVRASRAELYLLFLRQKGTNTQPEILRLFSGTSTIFDVIEKYAIYEPTGPYFCKDLAGNDVDGSIYSPVPNTICISIMKLSHKLARDEARNQALSLVAHEYSHLLGFDENDAQKLQNEVYNLLAEDSKERVYDMLKNSKDLFQMLKGAVINHRANAQPREWNYLCYVADKLMDYFGRLQSNDRLNQFSFFDSQQETTRYTYQMKAQALVFGSCGQSSYYPHKEDYRLVYEKLFQSNDVILANIFSEHFTDRPVDASMAFRRLKSVQDFEDELAEIAAYVEQSTDKALRLRNLYDAQIEH